MSLPLNVHTHGVRPARRKRINTGRLLLVSALVALLGSGVLPASAWPEMRSGGRSSGPGETEVQGIPVSTDGTGDANFVNGRGVLEGLHGAPDTRPASIDGLDIQEVRFSTPYETVKILNSDGSVERVEYVPTAFRITIQTYVDVLPTFGPSVYFGVPISMNGPCSSDPTLYFEAWIQGSDSHVDHPQQAEIRRHAVPSCAPEVTSEQYTLSIEGNSVTMEYPLELLSQVMDEGTELYAPPVILNRNLLPASRVVWWYHQPGMGAIRGEWSEADEAPRLSSFWVGSDVPLDVTCSQQPTHPDCQS